MTESFQHPRVGIGVWIRKDDKVLLGLRRSSHGQQTWCPPGGKLELFESFEDCAIRETLEETGVKIKNVRFAGVTNDLYRETNKHYVTLMYVADWKSGEPQTLEPDKMGDWEWFGWDQLPAPLLRSTQNFVNLKINPFEI